MSFNINEFRSHFGSHSGYAKASKFNVIIGVPPGVADLGKAAGDLSFQCESAELPGYTINAVDNRIYGVPNPVASGAAPFADVTLTFICAGDMWEKRFFDRWMDAIVPFDNYNVNYKYNYATSVKIDQYIETGDKAYSVVLREAFPVSTAPLTLNWADDGILKLAVTFKYEYWTQEGAIAPSTISARADGSTPDLSEIQIESRAVPAAPPRMAAPPPPPFVGQGGGFGGGGASGKF